MKRKNKSGFIVIVSRYKSVNVMDICKVSGRKITRLGARIDLVATVTPSLGIMAYFRDGFRKNSPKVNNLCFVIYDDMNKIMWHSSTDGIGCFEFVGKMLMAEVVAHPSVKFNMWD